MTDTTPEQLDIPISYLREQADKLRTELDRIETRIAWLENNKVARQLEASPFWAQVEDWSTLVPGEDAIAIIDYGPEQESDHVVGPVFSFTNGEGKGRGLGSGRVVTLLSHDGKPMRDPKEVKVWHSVGPVRWEKAYTGVDV